MKLLSIKFFRIVNLSIAFLTINGMAAENRPDLTEEEFHQAIRRNDLDIFERALAQENIVGLINSIEVDGGNHNNSVSEAVASGNFI